MSIPNIRTRARTQKYIKEILSRRFACKYCKSKNVEFCILSPCGDILCAHCEADHLTCPFCGRNIRTRSYNQFESVRYLQSLERTLDNDGIPCDNEEQEKNTDYHVEKNQEPKSPSSERIGRRTRQTKAETDVVSNLAFDTTPRRSKRKIKLKATQSLNIGIRQGLRSTSRQKTMSSSRVCEEENVENHPRYAPNKEEKLDKPPQETILQLVISEENSDDDNGIKSKKFKLNIENKIKNHQSLELRVSNKPSHLVTSDTSSEVGFFGFPDDRELKATAENSTSGSGNNSTITKINQFNGKSETKIPNKNVISFIRRVLKRKTEAFDQFKKVERTSSESDYKSTIVCDENNESNESYKIHESDKIKTLEGCNEGMVEVEDQYIETETVEIENEKTYLNTAVENKEIHKNRIAEENNINGNSSDDFDSLNSTNLQAPSILQNLLTKENPIINTENEEAMLIDDTLDVASMVELSSENEGIGKNDDFTDNQIISDSTESSVDQENDSSLQHIFSDLSISTGEDDDKSDVSLVTVQGDDETETPSKLVSHTTPSKGKVKQDCDDNNSLDSIDELSSDSSDSEKYENTMNALFIQNALKENENHGSFFQQNAKMYESPRATLDSPLKNENKQITPFTSPASSPSSSWSDKQLSGYNGQVIDLINSPHSKPLCTDELADLNSEGETPYFTDNHYLHHNDDDMLDQEDCKIFEALERVCDVRDLQSPQSSCFSNNDSYFSSNLDFPDQQQSKINKFKEINPSEYSFEVKHQPSFYENIGSSTPRKNSGFSAISSKEPICIPVNSFHPVEKEFQEGPHLTVNETNRIAESVMVEFNDNKPEACTNRFNEPPSIRNSRKNFAYNEKFFNQDEIVEYGNEELENSIEITPAKKPKLASEHCSDLRNRLEEENRIEVKRPPSPPTEYRFRFPILHQAIDPSVCWQSINELERMGNEEIDEQLVREIKLKERFVLSCDGLNKYEQSLVHDLAQKLGVPYEQLYSENTTHLVVPKTETMVCLKTLIVAMAIASGSYIITFDWVENCLRSDIIWPEDDYIVKCPGPLSCFNPRHPLFDGYYFCVQTDIVYPPPEAIKKLLILCGADVVDNVALFPEYLFSENSKFLIVQLETYEPDPKSEVKYGYLPVPFNWIFDSILQYDILPLDEYLINT